ncbi:MAG: Response regulator receiver protein [Parcubacteria group bacterium GW2011_GWA2_44_12]|nr:MAG: Response regulator receiver protein [Parcubacteria group bacterium GW2011_GWA2_44_12]
MSKILVVEDEQTLLKMIQITFEVAGYEVLTALNGKEAIEKLGETPDLILLDILMPGEDGIETLKKIKQRNDSREIPVIILTNFNDPEKRNAAKSAGAIDYLVKSDQDVDQILEKVKSLLLGGA